MADGINGPYGLKPRFDLTSTTYTGQLNRYPIDTAIAYSISTGDPVVVSTNNNGKIMGLIQSAAGQTGAQASYALAWLGVFQGCEYTDVNGILQNVPAWITGTAIKTGTTPTAFVTDDPNTLYSIQSSVWGNPAVVATSQMGIIQSNIFKNAGVAVGGNWTQQTVAPAIQVPNNPAYVTTGNFGGQSIVYLDISSIVTTLTYPLKIVGFSRDIAGNQVPYVSAGTVGVFTATVGQFNDVIVKINNHVYGSGTGTVGY